MSDEPTVAVMPPHAEFCDWSLSDGPCNCGLDDFVAVMCAQARREGADLGRRATLDPGAFVKRGSDYDGNAYGERLDQWQERAITKALRGDA